MVRVDGRTVTVQTLSEQPGRNVRRLVTDGHGSNGCRSPGPSSVITALVAPWMKKALERADCTPSWTEWPEHGKSYCTANVASYAWPDSKIWFASFTSRS